jgi:hypothetical protein
MEVLMTKAIFGLGLIVAISLTACPMPGTTTLNYTASLSAANEVPPNTSTATGTATATITGGTLTLTGTYSGLTGVPTMAHIHGPIATGQNTATPFCILQANEGPTVGAGTMTSVGFSCSTTTFSAADIADLDAGKFYVNIHTTKNASGEIRGTLIKK